MTLETLLVTLADQVPLVVAIAIILWLALPQLAERFVIVGKLLKPLSRRWREKAARLEDERRKVAFEEAKRLAKEAIAQITPPDVQKLQTRLDHVEDAEELLRAFVIYDELWHFHDAHNEARHGRVPAQRISFDLFERRWQAGWRPFDDSGQFTGDASTLPTDTRDPDQRS